MTGRSAGLWLVAVDGDSSVHGCNSVKGWIDENRLTDSCPVSLEKSRTETRGKTSCVHWSLLRTGKVGSVTSEPRDPVPHVSPSFLCFIYLLLFRLVWNSWCSPVWPLLYLSCKRQQQSLTAIYLCRTQKQTIRFHWDWKREGGAVISTIMPLAVMVMRRRLDIFLSREHWITNPVIISEMYL